MAEKEINILKDQLKKLEEKNFDLDAWKKHTVIFLERIFGSNNTKVKLIEELHYDFSSWNLRDVSGTGKTKNPIKKQASEILEAIIYELEMLGLPQETKGYDKLFSLLNEELTGKKIKEIELILNDNSPNKPEKIQEILNNLKKEDLSLILSRLLTS